MVELGEQLGDHSVHYSGFGLLGDMLRDQTKFREEEEEDEEEVLDNRLQKRSQQPTVIEARLPGYKPQEQKRQNGNLADCGLQDKLAEEGDRWQGDGRKSPIYMEILQQVKVNEDGGLEEKSGMMKLQVEPFADSLDLLPLEVEVEVHWFFCLSRILITIGMPMSNIIHFHQHELMTKSLLQVREDIMEQSMVYEGYVKSEGVYQGEGRLLFKNGTTVLCTISLLTCPILSNI